MIMNDASQLEKSQEGGVAVGVPFVTGIGRYSTGSVAAEIP
jgi:hypothetical protein